jgi:hypothetical protein
MRVDRRINHTAHASRVQRRFVRNMGRALSIDVSKCVRTVYAPAFVLLPRHVVE